MLCLQAPGHSGERGGPSPPPQIWYLPSLLLYRHSLPFPEHSITFFSMPSGYLSPNPALRGTCLQAFRGSFLPSSRGSDSSLEPKFLRLEPFLGLWFLFLHESSAPATAVSSLPPKVLRFPTLPFADSVLHVFNIFLILFIYVDATCFLSPLGDFPCSLSEESSLLWASSSHCLLSAVVL